MGVCVCVRERERERVCGRLQLQDFVKWIICFLFHFLCIFYSLFGLICMLKFEITYALYGCVGDDTFSSMCFGLALLDRLL